ncbi:MAG: hypothetical protein ACUVQZ_05550 [Candidatus Caldatribacteriaceae bacterium]
MLVVGLYPTNASVTGLYDTVGRSGWCELIAQELGIPLQKLPPVFSCLEVVGKVKREVAQITLQVYPREYRCSWVRKTLLPQP